MVNTDTFTGPSFGLGNRIMRLVWGIAWALLFRPTPKSLHRWRACVLRCFGARIGSGAHVYPGVRIWAPWNLEVGEETGVANGVNLYSQGQIRIGRRVVISQGTHLCGGTHDYEKEGFPLVTRPIEVGDQAWLAAEVFVHPGVTIGPGCVVGARSVVTRDLPGWTVCSGFPATVLRSRNQVSSRGHT